MENKDLEFKGTPGEWFQSHRKTDDGCYSTQVYTENGETIATLHWYPKPKEKGMHEGKPVMIMGTYREANAKLIAAAPELLEACQEFVRKCDVGESRSTRSYAQMKKTIEKALGHEN